MESLSTPIPSPEQGSGSPANGGSGATTGPAVSNTPTPSGDKGSPDASGGSLSNECRPASSVGAGVPGADPVPILGRQDLSPISSIDDRENLSPTAIDLLLGPSPPGSVIVDDLDLAREFLPEPGADLLAQAVGATLFGSPMEGSVTATPQEPYASCEEAVPQSSTFREGLQTVTTTMGEITLTAESSPDSPDSSPTTVVDLESMEEDEIQVLDHWVPSREPSMSAAADAYTQRHGTVTTDEGKILNWSTCPPATWASWEQRTAKSSDELQRTLKGLQKDFQEMLQQRAKTKGSREGAKTKGSREGAKTKGSREQGSK